MEVGQGLDRNWSEVREKPERSPETELVGGKRVCTRT